jgi:hypothetical protein
MIKQAAVIGLSLLSFSCFANLQTAYNIKMDGKPQLLAQGDVAQLSVASPGGGQAGTCWLSTNNSNYNATVNLISQASNKNATIPAI